METLSRHWKELMEKTGQKFDMNPESLTLSNIFAMQLHRFQEKIGEVVNCAIKESANEKVRLLIWAYVFLLALIYSKLF